MKKQRNNQGSSDSTNQDVFADFNPPRTTDGSYRGTMKRVKATEAHLEAKFEERFREVNQRLKDAKTRVSITRKGNSLQLQATLPPKPGSDKVKPHQQLISLGTPANLPGLQTAWEDATELGKLLARKQFEWNEKYLNSKVEEIKEIRLTEYYASRFEEKYFQSHKRTILSENTFRNYKDIIKRYIGHDTPFEKKALEEKIKQLSPWGIKQACVLVQIIVKTFELNFKIEIKKPKIEYEVRNIPSDAEIVTSYALFDDYARNKKNSNKGLWKNDSSWILFQWCYGMLATYGLRPRELFVNPDIDWWLSEKNVNNTWRVSHDTKTGKREVLPFVPEWVEIFDLKNQVALNKLREKTTKILTLCEINSLRQNVSRYFNKVKVEFQPYDLRHACAIRAHLQGMRAKVAADNLGHSVEQHTETYQRWISIELRAQSMQATFTEKNEVNELKNEIIQLKLEVERLKIENERYRLMSAENHHLNG